MRIREVVEHLMPHGSEAMASLLEVTTNGPKGVPLEKCPNWPVDLFAVAGSLIERSGCYTLACPDRSDLKEHEVYLDRVNALALAWNLDVLAPPPEVVRLWERLVNEYGDTPVDRLSDSADLVRCLLTLFAIADEACIGMGWDVREDEANTNMFAALALVDITGKERSTRMIPNLPASLCIAVPPDRAIVLPKSITSSVGCTIRSLSHYLALLPPESIVAPSWILSSKQRSVDSRPDPQDPYDLRLLLIPFPFVIHAESFQLSTPRTSFGVDNHIPAYFKLVQRWLEHAGQKLTGRQLADELFLPLIQQAVAESAWMPNGIVLPECALSSGLARELVQALADSGIEFLITGVLDTVPETGITYNRAQTFVIRPGEGAVVREQNKHHRWRLDRHQTDRYALDFDPDPCNDKWWEDIDVGQRKLPLFGLRKDMSLATLICEDLARTDPAMAVIKAVGPNLVVALLMDGPQLAARWPGRYATVLAEDPGSAVLSFTCAALVDRSNWLEAKPARSIGLWRDAGGTTQEIGLPPGSLGVLLTLQSARKHQNTLDNRTDHSLSRQLTLRTVVPLFIANRPEWL